MNNLLLIIGIIVLLVVSFIGGAYFGGQYTVDRLYIYNHDVLGCSGHDFNVDDFVDYINLDGKYEFYLKESN